MKKAMANILSALILILSVLLLLLPYLPPALAGRLVGIGYGALVIIIANILATLLRKRWWRRVHLAIVVLSLPLIWAYVPIIPKEPKPGQQSVSIVSWNVDNFLVSRDTMLQSARYMRTLQPDIICLQERPHEVKVAWTDILDALRGTGGHDGLEECVIAVDNPGSIPVAELRVYPELNAADITDELCDRRDGCNRVFPCRNTRLDI